MRQKSIAGDTTGSFVNYLMGNNSTKPEVGKGATLLMWTDRHAYEVMEVLNDGKRVRLRQYDAERTDDNGMSDSQSYKYEKLNETDEFYVWRYSAWYREVECIRLTKEYNEQYKILKESASSREAFDQMYQPLLDEHGDLKVVEGKTEKYKKYSKVNIIFGVKDEYYDYTL